MSLEWKPIHMKTLPESQFGYYPLIWMFHGKKVNAKLSQLQEKFLRIVNDD